MRMFVFMLFVLFLKSLPLLVAVAFTRADKRAPRRCGVNGITRTHRARTGAGLRGDDGEISRTAGAVSLRGEGRSVRKQAPLQYNFSEGRNVRRRPGFWRGIYFA